jgi:hypothetical protein
VHGQPRQHAPPPSSLPGRALLCGCWLRRAFTGHSCPEPSTLHLSPVLCQSNSQWRLRPSRPRPVDRLRIQRVSFPDRKVGVPLLHRHTISLHSVHNGPCSVPIRAEASDPFQDAGLLRIEGCHFPGGGYWQFISIPSSLTFWAQIASIPARAFPLATSNGACIRF